MSWATRKPSRVVASRKPPVNASRGANATAWTRTSKPSQRDLRCANPFEISSSEATSMTKVISEPNCRASGTTRSVMRSIWAKASSAPWACMACAMPQAMERSVASPTINARLPLKKPMFILSRRLRAEFNGVEATAYFQALRATANGVEATPTDILSALLPVLVDVHDEALPGSDLMMLVEAIPALELRHRHLKLTRNAEDRVAATHGI